MELDVISTGSCGNCFLLKHDNNILMLDAGIQLDRILKSVNHDLSSVNGVLISHQHL